MKYARSHFFRWSVVGAVMICAGGLGAMALEHRAQAAEGNEKAPRAALQAVNALSEAFEYAAGEIQPSVVSIQSTKHIHPTMLRENAPGPMLGWNLPFGPQFLQHYFGNESKHELEFTQQGLGSGVIIDRQGNILTNNHVIDGTDDLMVKLHDGRVLRAHVVGCDPASDLAVIRVTADNLKPAELGDSDQLKVGQWVLAVGDPFGLSDTITAGIVSGKGRANMRLAKYESFIQTDAAINPGNSGGPLVDVSGRIVGINTAIASSNGGNMGVGFAIPVNMAKNVMTSLIGEGHVTRGWLGVAIQGLNTGLAKSFNYDSTRGALTSDVQPDSPASKAGIQPGDIIVNFANHPIADPDELRNRVAECRPGTDAKVTVVRNGKSKQISVTIGKLGEESAGATGPNENNSSDELGLTVQNLSPSIARELGYSANQAGVLVTEVSPGSLAAEAGIQPNDVIVDVQGDQVRSAQQFSEELNRNPLGKGVRMIVRSGDIRHFVYVQAES